MTKAIITSLLSLACPLFAGTATIAPCPVIQETESLWSGSFTAAYATLCNGRGIVASHSVAQGDSAVGAILKWDRDFEKDSAWSYHGLCAYYAVTSGHTLYGDPAFGGIYTGLPGSIHSANIENEFIVYNEFRYDFKNDFSMGLAHNFMHGGLYGVMAKHWADQANSAVNEFVLTPDYSPYKWLSFSANIRYSFQGMTGWWFEPSITFKAPLIGTEDDIKMAALLSFNMSMTADYYEPSYENSTNGAQAWWIKLATPYYVGEEKNFIITPSVSFNWAGSGTKKANERSAYAQYSGNSSFVPFRDFAVIGTIYFTYKF